VASFGLKSERASLLFVHESRIAIANLAFSKIFQKNPKVGRGCVAGGAPPGGIIEARVIARLSFVVARGRVFEK
jgi:hypothetical protein